MIKNNLTISDFFDCICLILHFRNFIQHFRNTVCRCSCNHDHDKYKCYHIQGHQNLQCINDHAGQLTGLHCSEYNTFSANQSNQQYNCIHHKLHDRCIPCNDFFCFCKQCIYVIRYTMEFTDLMFFSYKRLYYAGCIHVFLHGIVQLIILIKYFDKIRMCLLCNKNQCSTEKRNYDQEKKCDLYINQQCHDPGKCDHDRCSFKKTDTHHISHLHIRDIRCHSCDQS